MAPGYSMPYLIGTTTMRTLLRASASLLAAVFLVSAAPGARADELLVMPYTCSVRGGHVVLRSSPDEAHRILSRREQREFTACSPADPAACRKWTIHRFDVDCGGERVPWTSVVAAADQEGRAGIVDGQFQIRMPRWWTLPSDDPCAMRGPRFGARDFDCVRGGIEAPPAVVRMPYGFAPSFGIDAIFIPDDGRRGIHSPQPRYAGPRDTGPWDTGRLASGPYDRPAVGSYERRGSGPDMYADDYGVEEDVYAGAPDVYDGPRDSRYSAPEPDNIPFKIAPPGEGLTVEPRVEPQAEREPEVAFVEPPPLPERLDPSIRSQFARSQDEEPAGSEQPLAQPPLMADARPAADAGSPAAPEIINNPAAAASEITPTNVSSSAENGHAEKAAQPTQEAGSLVTSDAAATVPVDPATVAANDAPPPAAESTQPEPAASLPDLQPIEPDGGMDVAARLLRGDPSAIAGAVIGGGLLAILILGVILKLRRRDDLLPEPVHRDISSISFEKGSTPNEPFSMDLPPSPAMSATSSRDPGMGGPTLSFSSSPPARGGEGASGAREPSLQSVPGLDDTMPQTRSEALRVLGIGAGRDTSPAAIRRIVESLRQSWNPDDAADEDDRRVRTLMLKQVNAAWEILSQSHGTKDSDTKDSEEAKRLETLHHL